MMTPRAKPVSHSSRCSAPRTMSRASTAAPSTCGSTDGGSILVHVARIQVRWGDLDALGHVNAAKYFTYFEQARADWMRVHGLTIQTDQGLFSRRPPAHSADRSSIPAVSASRSTLRAARSASVSRPRTAFWMRRARYAPKARASSYGSTSRPIARSVFRREMIERLLSVRLRTKAR
jgi:hypothetical protein